MTTKRKDIIGTTPKRSYELSPWEEMDRMFDTFLHRGWLRPFHELFPEWPGFGERENELRMPRVDMVDEEAEVVVRAELPGVDKKHLDVNLSGQTLTIKGETKREEQETEGEYYRSEIVEGTFSRTLHLPEEVDAEKVKAVFKDGMLEVRLPKAHKAPRQRITVE